jgi:hypothetical protein
MQGIDFPMLCQTLRHGLSLAKFVSDHCNERKPPVAAGGVANVLTSRCRQRGFDEHFEESGLSNFPFYDEIWYNKLAPQNDFNSMEMGTNGLTVFATPRQD